ncbi:hypothetical protein [Labrys neptuniae]
MFFILRMMFWLAVVALLLPASPAPHDRQASANLSTSTLADKAVSAALSYCATSPQQCAAGLAGARQLGGLLAGPSDDVATAPAPAAQRFTALPPPRPAIP